MKFDTKFTQFIEEFEDSYPERHTDSEGDVDYSHQTEELKQAIENYLRSDGKRH